MTSPGEPRPLGALILAGGLSRRMGRPKALHPLHGSTFLEKIVHSYEIAGIDSMLIVTHAALADEPDFPRFDGPELLVLDQATTGPLETLWRGLDRIRDRWSAFFLHPVDFPFVHTDTLKALARVYQEGKPLIVQPRCKDAGGHPIILDLSLHDEIRSASPDEGLRQVVRADPSRVRKVRLEDEGILKGVNRPEDLNSEF